MTAKSSTYPALKSWTVPAAAGLGLVAMFGRTATAGGTALALGVGAMGALAPLATASRGPRALDAGAGDDSAIKTRGAQRVHWIIISALAVSAFMLAGRFGPRIPSPGGLQALAITVTVAVAEELFFRRLVYGWLERWGAGIAIAGSALAFAAVHVPAYGVHVLPLDFAAGLVFGWQRWATGGWTSSALAHVAANLVR